MNYNLESCSWGWETVRARIYTPRWHSIHLIVKKKLTSGLNLNIWSTKKVQGSSTSPSQSLGLSYYEMSTQMSQMINPLISWTPHQSCETVFATSYPVEAHCTDALTSTQASSPSLPFCMTSTKWHTQISIHLFNLGSESWASEDGHCGKGGTISSAAGNASQKGQTIIGFVWGLYICANDGRDHQEERMPLAKTGEPRLYHQQALLLRSSQLFCTHGSVLSGAHAKSSKCFFCPGLIFIIANYSNHYKYAANVTQSFQCK